MFPDILKDLRNQKKVTQEELANHLSLSKQAVSAWEIGRTEPDNDTLKKIADFFDVTIDYLLGRTSNIDQEYSELYNRVYNNPDLKIFFDQASTLTKEDLKWVLSIVEKVKEEHNKNNY